MQCSKCNFINPPSTRFCGQCGIEFQTSDIVTETLRSSSRELARGSILANRYDIIEEIGSGGMGKVYKAYDKKIEEKIAIKLIRPEIAVDKEILERFNNEMKITRKIVHKNICRMFDLGESDGNHFITMEYVSGEDLKNLITRIGQFTIKKTVSTAIQILEGLVEAHESGIVHRDLKPQNVMIDNKGNVRIMDFGIARSLFTKRITRTGTSIGTPLYMSPEQADGTAIDQRSDIYSFGIILYEMLTGQVPFEGETPTSIAFKHKYEKPQNPKEINPHIPDNLNNILLKCIEKDPNKRYNSAKEVLAELEKSEKVKVRKKGGDRKKIIIPSLLGISILVIITFAIWFFVIRPAPPTPPIPPIPPTPTIEEYFAKAENHWNNQEYAEAIKNYEAILDLESDNIIAQLNIAHVLKDQGKIDEAIPAYEEAISLSPDQPQPYKNLGEIFYQREEYISSLTYYKEYFSRAPPDSPDLDETEELIMRLEDLVKPEPEPEPEPKPKPPEPEPVEQRIRIALSRAKQAYEKGNYSESIGQLERVLRLDPNHTVAQNDLKLAKQKLATKEIEALLQEYNNALKNNQLPGFYERRCTSELYEDVRNDAEIISNLYSSFKSEVANQEIRFIDGDKAEVTFSNKIVGILKETGEEQTIFDGTFYWTVIKYNEGWKIIVLDYKSPE